MWCLSNVYLDGIEEDEDGSGRIVGTYSGM